jgi:hypothetical protein
MFNVGSRTNGAKFEPIVGTGLGVRNSTGRHYTCTGGPPDNSPPRPGCAAPVGSISRRQCIARAQGLVDEVHDVCQEAIIVGYIKSVCSLIDWPGCPLLAGTLMRMLSTLARVDRLQGALTRTAD